MTDLSTLKATEPLRILLADDENIARMALAAPLRRLGYEVVAVASGSGAIAELRRQDFDLLLLDIEMPDGDGFDVLQHLRGHPLPRWMPVLITSGHQDEDEVTRALELGADDYLIKPINIGFLCHKVRNFERAIGLQKQNLTLLRNVMGKNQELENWRNLEFEYSTRIQRTLLYGSVPAAPGGIHTSVRAQAAQGINGDFIEILSVYPDTVDLIIGDVMGKGPLAAIMGADVKLQVQRQITSRLVANRDTRFSVSEIVNDIHRSLTPKLIQLDSFVTLSYARIDRASGQLSVVCCGHPPLLLLGPTGCQPVGAPGLPLGVMEREVYEEQRYPVAPGMSVVAYSDGLSEAGNAVGACYGEAQLMDDLADFSRHDWGANAMAEMVYASVLRFTDGHPLRDDLTLLVAYMPLQQDAGQRLVLARQLDAIATLRQQVAAFALGHGLAQDLADRMVLVAVEAFTNTVRHSRSEIQHAAMEVLLDLRADAVWMRMEAPGPAYITEETQLEDVTTPDLRREGGFGIPIIHALTRSQGYRHSKGVNRLELEFARPPA